jgi:hypothetical protein
MDDVGLVQVFENFFDEESIKVTGGFLARASTAGIALPTFDFDHFAKLGFAKVEEEESGQTRLELLVVGTVPEIALMKAASHGFARLERSFR